MSIEKNKRDFEYELREVERAVEDMAGMVGQELLDPIERMFWEYKKYFQSDIEELMEKEGCVEELETENAELQSRVDTLSEFEAQVGELEDEIGDLKERIAELEDEANAD